MALVSSPSWAILAFFLSTVYWKSGACNWTSSASDWQVHWKGTAPCVEVVIPQYVLSSSIICSWQCTNDLPLIRWEALCWRVCCQSWFHRWSHLRCCWCEKSYEGQHRIEVNFNSWVVLTMITFWKDLTGYQRKDILSQVALQLSARKVCWNATCSPFLFPPFFFFFALLCASKDCKLHFVYSNYRRKLRPY